MSSVMAHCLRCVIKIILSLMCACMCMYVCMYQAVRSLPSSGVVQGMMCTSSVMVTLFTMCKKDYSPSGSWYKSVYTYMS